MGNNSVVVIGLVNIHRQSIVIGHGGNHFEEMKGVGTNNDFLLFTFVLFEFVGVENDID
jgi:hypothetical protein